MAQHAGDRGRMAAAMGQPEPRRAQAPAGRRGVVAGTRSARARRAHQSPRCGDRRVRAGCAGEVSRDRPPREPRSRAARRVVHRDHRLGGPWMAARAAAPVGGQGRGGRRGARAATRQGRGRRRGRAIGPSGAATRRRRCAVGTAPVEASPRARRSRRPGADRPRSCQRPRHPGGPARAADGAARGLGRGAGGRACHRAAVHDGHLAGDATIAALRPGRRRAM